MINSSDFIEKARVKHNPGDVHPKYPNYTWQQKPDGKWDWVSDKKRKEYAAQSGASQTTSKQEDGSKNSKPKSEEKQSGRSQQASVDIKQMTRQELVDWAKKTNEKVLSEIVNKTDGHLPARQVAYDELKERGADVSKLKTDGIKTKSYQTKKPEVNIKLTSFTHQSKKTGKRETFKYSDIKSQYSKLGDDNIINIVNSQKMPAERRHIAWEIAEERGIPEDKLDVAGGLQKFWDNQKKMQEDLSDNSGSDADDDEWESVDTGLGDFDVDGFMEQFPENDMAWMDASDSRVLEAFGGKSKKLDTIAKRQLYDNFIDHQKRLNPNYVSAKKQLGRMKKGYLAFLSERATRPMMVAAGGAGVGKTHGLRQVIEDYKGMAIYDEEEAKKAEEQGIPYTDFDAIFAPQINSLPKLAKFLSKYPDKIVVFDDNDDLLTNPDMANVMKTLADTNPKARFFPEYDDKGKATGKNNVFKGKMIILTNKSSDDLNKNEDAKAVMSRATKQEIKFTVQENIETLKDRYLKMKTGVEIPGIDAAEEKQIREDIFDYIAENKNKLDPAKFTVRKFIDIYEKIAQEKEAEEIASTSADAAEDFEPEDWRDSALEILNKADDSDELADYDVAFHDPEDDWSEEEKREFREIAKKIDSDESEDELEDELITGKSNKKKSKKHDEVQKSLFDDMSLKDAEDLLLG